VTYPATTRKNVTASGRLTLMTNIAKTSTPSKTKKNKMIRPTTTKMNAKALTYPTTTRNRKASTRRLTTVTNTAKMSTHPTMTTMTNITKMLSQCYRSRSLFHVCSPESIFEAISRVMKWGNSKSHGTQVTFRRNRYSNSYCHGQLG